MVNCNQIRDTRGCWRSERSMFAHVIVYKYIKLKFLYGSLSDMYGLMMKLKNGLFSKWEHVS